jgi:hypothetical protein
VCGDNDVRIFLKNERKERSLESPERVDLAVEVDEKVNR